MFDFHRDRTSLDRDPAFAFKIHVVEDLVLHFAFGDRPGVLKQAVGERTFAVIDVGDDTKVADVLGVDRG